MINYTSFEEISLFKSCKSGIELLEMRTALEELQSISKLGLRNYDFMMSGFLALNQI